MKINKFKIAIIALASAFTFVACEDYIDVNESPNGPNQSGLIPEIVMPGAQTLNSATLMTDMNLLGNTMVQTWAGNAQQTQTPYSTEFQYLVTPEFYDGEIWEPLYLDTGNLTHIINFDNGNNYDYFKASALILRSFYFQYLVDLYGDIPYTEAHQRGDNLFPNYDNQEDVYRGLVADVNTAINMIDNTDMSTVIAMDSSNDPMIKGDMDMWKKFGNTVKLRLLTRMMSKAQEGGDANLNTFITTEMASINNGGQLLGAGEDVTITPGYSDEASKMNPFAQRFGYSATNFGNAANATFNQIATGPTVFLVEFLDGTTNGVNDPRLARLYTQRPGQANITGNVQGDNVNLPSRLGPGLLSSPTQIGYIMTAAEALFLQAEARQRGYLTSGTAKGYYDAAVAESFRMLGVTGQEGTVINSNVNLLDWDASTGNEIETIITQKWIALGGTNGIETWIEYTRTGFPSNMTLPVSTSRPNRPIRLLYPSSEYIGNSAVVNAYGQTNDTAFDTTGSRIFWDYN